MAELQTASAICGIVRTTWQTIEFFKDVLRAQDDAQMLWQRTKTAYQLVQSLDSVIKLRQDSLSSNARPLNASIVHIIETATKNCQHVLDELARKCITLGARHDLGRGAHAKAGISFAMSAKSIHKFETGLLSATNMVQIALALLHDDRLERIECILQKIVAAREPASALEHNNNGPIPSPNTIIHTRQDSAIGLEEAETFTPVLENLNTRSTTTPDLQLLAEDLQDEDSPSPMLGNIQKFREDVEAIFGGFDGSLSKAQTWLPASNTRQTPNRGNEYLNTPSIDSGSRSSTTLAEDGIQTNSEETALHLAVEHGNLDFAKELLSNGADLDALAPRTPLVLAVKRNKPIFVEALLEAGANIHVVDEHRWSIVHFAVDRGAEEALRILLQRAKSDGLDLDIDARCEMDWTPLMHLAELDRPENVRMARTLLDHGANVNASDANGYTALWYAVQGHFSGERNRFIRELLEKNADDEPITRKASKRRAVFPAFKSRRKSSAVLT